MNRQLIALLAVLTFAVAALAVSTFLLLQAQREQKQQLNRLQDCLTILERNQGTPADQPTMGCPIYD